MWQLWIQILDFLSLFLKLLFVCQFHIENPRIISFENEIRSNIRKNTWKKKQNAFPTQSLHTDSTALILYVHKINNVNIVFIYFRKCWNISFDSLDNTAPFDGVAWMTQFTWATDCLMCVYKKDTTNFSTKTKNCDNSKILNKTLIPICSCC